MYDWLKVRSRHHERADEVSSRLPLRLYVLRESAATSGRSDGNGEQPRGVRQGRVLHGTERGLADSMALIHVLVIFSLDPS